MKNRSLLTYISIIALFFVSILTANGQCEFRVADADTDLSSLDIAPAPSQEQVDAVEMFLGASLDNYILNLSFLKLRATGVFSPEEVQGVMSILCGNDCIFRLDNLINDGLGIHINPLLTEVQLNSVINFLGDNFDNASSTYGSAIMQIFVKEALTPEEVQGIFSTLCGSQCIFSFDMRNGDQTLNIRPKLTDDQLNAVLEALEGGNNPPSGHDQLSISRTQIFFNNPIGQEEIALAGAALCPDAPIPTMGEWGILILGLFIVVIAIVTLKDKIKKIALSMFSF